MSAVAVAGVIGGARAQPASPAEAELLLDLPGLSAAERLELSRQRLRAAMQPSAPRLPHAAAGDGALPDWAASLWARLRSVPVAQAVADVLHSWWANHPLRAAALVAQDTARSVAAPLAKRHPLALVAGALLAGAVLSRLRPWRWLPRTMLFAGLLPQIASKLVTLVPVDSWLHGLSSLASSPPAKAPRRAGPA